MNFQDNGTILCLNDDVVPFCSVPGSEAIVNFVLLSERFIAAIWRGL